MQAGAGARAGPLLYMQADMPATVLGSLLQPLLLLVLLPLLTLVLALPPLLVNRQLAGLPTAHTASRQQPSWVFLQVVTSLVSW